MRLYNPNPKHEGAGQPGRRGTKLDISAMEALQLLNDSLHCIACGRQFVGVKDGKIYVFQGDDVQGYHAYPETGQEVCRKYPEIASEIATLLGTTYKRLSRMDE